MAKKHKVVVGLSGGVDSAVSAWLLKQQGHEVLGIFMKNWEDDDDSEYCSSNIDFLDAASVADVLGIEIEHVNIEALEQLEKEGIKVYPQPHLLRMIQDKRTQKAFFKTHNFPTADFRLIESAAEIAENEDFLPAFNKLGKGGYDGKGVQYIGSVADAHKGFDAPGLLEKAINFDKELEICKSDRPVKLAETTARSKLSKLNSPFNAKAPEIWLPNLLFISTS